MSVEFSAICPEEPSSEIVGRLAELLVGLALGANIPVTADVTGDGAQFRLGSAATTLMTASLPGTHEFGDAVVLTTDDRDRTPESRLLALVVVLAGTAVTGGRLLDEGGFLRVTSVREVLAALLAGRPSGADEVLTRVMGSGAEVT
ncbi:MAG: hypothetical protein ACK5O2_13515 [Microthrixaceae bacterium]